MNPQIIYFIIALLIPPIYYRGLYLLFPKLFYKRFIKEKTGLSIHHIHYGVIYTLIAIVLFLFLDKNIYIIILFGLGMGFMLDEFAPATLIDMKRKDELKIYARAQKATIFLFLAIIIILILLSIFI